MDKIWNFHEKKNGPKNIYFIEVFSYYTCMQIIYLCIHLHTYIYRTLEMKDEGFGMQPGPTYCISHSLMMELKDFFKYVISLNMHASISVVPRM